MDRLQAEVRARGMTVFARIDHAAGAAEVGLTLRPTELIIFGNARGGTPLMESVQTVGIDLPLKALVWEDASGKTWLSYNEPGWIAQRHGKYSFDALAQTVLAFTDAHGLKRYALYVFDYGVPTGFRLALARPERVKRSFHRMAMLTKKA